MDLMSLKVVTWIWKPVSKLAGKVYHALAPRIANSLHQYDRYYRERHGTTKISCVGMQEPIPLDNVYVAVHFLPQEQGSKYGSLKDIEQAFRQGGKRRSALNFEKRQDGMKIANNKQYLMVLGGPGVGKSTFLRKVGLETLKKNGDFEHQCIPVFLELKRLPEDQIDIEALITKEFEICGYPYPQRKTMKALKSGKLLILFDGLDEVPAAKIDNVIRKIEDFVDQYSQNRFIASCRIAAYTRRFKQFTDVEMAEFDGSQVKAYINNWFASTSDLYRHQLDKEMKTAERCWKALNEKEHRSTRELARNPLLLTLLCMVYDKSQNFPRNRADLYEKALNIFLEEWAAEKRVRRDLSVNQYLDISTEKRMLYEIAAKNFDENRLFFSESELIDQIKTFGEGNANTPPMFDASKILETIVVDQGLFVERVSRFYSFSHLTFQEYLTASYIVRDTRSIQGLVTDHLHHERWREVFLLTAGLMHEADNLLVKMKTEVAKSINTDGLKALFRWAKCITDTSDTSCNGIAKRAFAIHQYFSLWRLNKICQAIESIVNRYSNPTADYSLDQERHFYLNRDFNRYRDLYQDINHELDPDLYQEPYNDIDIDLYIELTLYPHLYRSFDPSLHLYQKIELTINFDLDLDFYQNLYLDLDLFLKIILNSHRTLYQDRYPELYPDLNLYQNLYRYMNTDLYPPIFSELGDRGHERLDRGIKLVEGLERSKIFKGVDLQRMVQQFNEQQEFIKASRKGKPVKPPEESIHDAWISVLGITDDMLAISHEEMENYIQYLRAVELIVKCKEAAGRVTHEIWKQIEDRLLTGDAEGTED